jgi:predicted  nucleic acid-binding Zn-ribbon protein
VVLSSLAFGALSLAACDRSDAVSQAIDEARRSLSAMHSGGVTPASEEARLEAYAAALRTLQPAANSGEPGQQSAAQVLIAHAHAGQGQIAASRATDLENEALGKASVVRSLIEQSVLLRLEHASALESVSSVDQQAEAEAQIRQVEAQEAAKRTDLRSLQDNADALRQQVAQAKSEAGQHRTTENQLRSQALTAEGDARADLVTRAVEAQREGDAAERRASDLEAEIAMLEPQIAQTERELQSLQTRISLLRDSRERMAARDESQRTAAGDDRRAAQAAATQIDQLLRQLDDFRENELAAAYEEAIGEFQIAADSMRRARSGASDRSAIAIAMGGFMQSVGDLERARSTGLERYASVLELAASNGAGLPARSTYQQFLSRVQASMAETQTAAEAAYADAIDAFESAGARGDVADRVDRIVQSLRGEAAEPESYDAQDDMDVEDPNADAYDDSVESESGDDTSSDG